MPCDDGRQRTTTDDVVRCHTEVDVRRRAVCERAFTRTDLNSDWLKPGADFGKTMTLLLESKDRENRKIAFANLGDVSNIYSRTAQSGLRKVSLFSSQNVFIYVCLTA